MFEDSGNPLSTAYAGCYDAVFFIQPFQILRDLDREFTTRAAQRMTQGNGAAIDIYDGGIDLQLADHGQGLGGEGLIKLHQVDLPKVHSCLPQCFGDRFHRSDAHDAGMDTRAGAGYQSGYWAQAQFIHHFFSHHDHKGGPVARLGRVSGRDAAACGEDGFELSQRFQGSIGAGTFIRIHDKIPFLPFSFFIHIHLLYGNGQDPLFEITILKGVDRFLVGLIGELVLVFPAYIIFLCYGFSREAHIKVIVRVFRSNGISRYGLPPGSRYIAHTLRSACNDTLGLSRPDLGRCNSDRLYPTGAIPVHRHPRGMNADGPRGNDTSHLEALLGFRYGIPYDHIIHPVRVELRYGSHQSFNDLYGKIIRTVEPEFPSFGFSYCGAKARYDICFLHKKDLFKEKVVYATFSLKDKIFTGNYRIRVLYLRAVMYKFLRNLLFLFPAEGVHHFSMEGLKWACKPGFLRRLIASSCRPEEQGSQKAGLARDVFGLHFRNPVGLGAGFDKNALYLRELDTLGFGFVEIGTVTPQPQAGNDQPRLFRLREDQALINRMGFNNHGVDVIAGRLKKWREQQRVQARGGMPLIVGGNIGKNKMTPNEEAWKDYERCFRGLFGLVDYFVVNVSSPNTPGLRELQEKEALRRILVNLQEINLELSRAGSTGPVPLLLKISPDLSRQQVDDVIGLALEIKLDGLVAANTTISREDLLSSAARLEAIGAGGLSGAPLKERSTGLVRYIHGKTKDSVPLIASGGIFTGEDAEEKINEGASLVQVWTGFIYEGPFIVYRICNNFIRSMHPSHPE